MILNPKPNQPLLAEKHAINLLGPTMFRSQVHSEDRTPLHLGLVC